MNYCYVGRNANGDYYCGGDPSLPDAYGPRNRAQVWALDQAVGVIKTDNGIQVEAYIDGSSVPLTTPLFMGISGDVKSYVTMIQYAGSEDCIQAILVALQSSTLSEMSHAMPMLASDAIFRTIYRFDPPAELRESVDYLLRVVQRIRALNTAMAPANAEDAFALTVDSVKALLYEEDQTRLFDTIREIYRFRGSLDHFTTVPVLLLRELYFMVTHRQAKDLIGPTEMVREIVVTVGCESIKIERDPDTLALAEQLQAVRGKLQFTSEQFAEKVGMSIDSYKAAERGDIALTIPEMTAILHFIHEVLP